jgi:hypothetical protein
MQTPIEKIIEIVNSVPSDVITKENILNTLRNMLPTEQEHLEGMADALNITLVQMGVRGMSGKELFERRYKGIVTKPKFH